MSDDPAPAGPIVVGVDGSEPSRQALRWARALADSSGLRVDAIATWAMPVTAGGLGWVDVPSDWDRTQEITAMLDHTLAEVFGVDQPQNLRPLVRHGLASEVLLEASKGAYMVVVGNRGHGGFTGMLLGSVSAACTERAACPVVVVRGDTPPPPTR